MKTDLVVTTIFEPEWLGGYLDDIEKHGRVEEVTLRVICDRKTPSSVYLAAKQATDRGFQVDCPTLEEQETYLQKIGLPADYIPWNTDNRRNIGFLRAWEQGAEVLISIDDDNYCLPGADFVGAHRVVGERVSQVGGDLKFASGAPWFNIGDRLDAGLQQPIFPRGYPYRARLAESANLSAGPVGNAEDPVIAINAGLWIDDPDVDALTRIVQRPRVETANSDSVVLAPETWSPVNTQNTALIRQAIPAYYYIRMGYPLGGMQIDRFGDILSGFFVQKCAKHLGHAIRFGSPVARHARSPHNLFRDLYHELAGIVIVEELLPWLQELKLDGESYQEAYASLADAMEEEAGHFTGFVWDQGGQEFLRETARLMRVWLKRISALA